MYVQQFSRKNTINVRYFYIFQRYFCIFSLFFMVFLTKQPISYPSYTHKINAILMYINVNSTNYNCLAASCFLTDNNYQSAQSFSINFHFYWLKIGKIGNYCQFKHQRCEFVELTLHYMFSLREETLINVSSMKKGNGLIRFIWWLAQYYLYDQFQINHIHPFPYSFQLLNHKEICFDEKFMEICRRLSDHMGSNSHL